MRKSVLFAIICFLTLSLCGCTAINYFVCENSEGNISYGAMFSFEEEKFKSTQDFNKAKDYTCEKLIEQGLLVLEKAKTIEENNENLKINVLTKINAIEISTFASLVGNLVVVSDSATLEKLKQADEVVYTVVFKSIDDYNAFNAGSSKAESTPIKEKTFFEIKNGSSRVYNFGETIENLAYIEEIKTKFSSYLKEGSNDIDYSYIDFSYSYITPHRQIKSNANSVEKFGGLYYHTWSVPSSSMTIAIDIYTSYPNPVGYYVTSLGVSVVLTAVFVVWHFVNKRKIKNSNNSN